MLINKKTERTAMKRLLNTNYVSFVPSVSHQKDPRGKQTLTHIPHGPFLNSHRGLTTHARCNARRFS